MKKIFRLSDKQAFNYQARKDVYRGLLLCLVPRAVLHPFLLPFFAPFSARLDSKKGARGGDWVGDLERGRP